MKKKYKMNNKPLKETKIPIHIPKSPTTYALYVPSLKQVPVHLSPRRPKRLGDKCIGTFRDRDIMHMSGLGKKEKEHTRNRFRKRVVAEAADGDAAEGAAEPAAEKKVRGRQIPNCYSILL